MAGLRSDVYIYEEKNKKYVAHEMNRDVIEK